MNTPAIEVDVAGKLKELSTLHSVAKEQGDMVEAGRLWREYHALLKSAIAEGVFPDLWTRVNG